MAPQLGSLDSGSASGSLIGTRLSWNLIFSTNKGAIESDLAAFGRQFGFFLFDAAVRISYSINVHRVVKTLEMMPAHRMLQV